MHEKICESLREHATVWDQCHFIGDCRGILYLKKFLKFSYNESNYDDHFIMKELAKEFERQFTCFWENTKKYTFSVPIEKEVTIIFKNGEEITKNISYRYLLIV